MLPAANHILHGLCEIAQRDPKRILFTLVDDTGADAQTRSAAQLLERVMRLAAYLRDGCGLQPGDTALLIYPPSMEFIEAFAACQYAGIIAAPVYPPNLARPHSDLQRLNAIAASSGAKAMLTNTAYRWASRMSAAKEMLAGAGARWPNLPWYVTEGLAWFRSKMLQPVESAGSDIALLQFTSGSTSVPKGVRLSHRNLIHQLDLNAELLHIKDDSRLAMWVPQYHDLGLISGICAVLRGRGALWFMSPLSFLKKPALWFDLMHRVRATHTASPNFGYELACRKTTPEMRAKWDLSALQVYMNAAEPIVPRTMDQFIADFAPSGLSAQAFCPAYGLAEHAVGVTIWGKKRLRLDRQTLVEKRFVKPDGEGDLELIGCGSAQGGVALRIVEPGGDEVLAERWVGEICVQSDSVADGYQGLTELNAQVFQATLKNEHGYWLRTGDLGFVHEGELYVTGRQKDLVIIRGRNMHPEDIEESVRRAHQGIRAGGVVAFSVPGLATEELVVLLEVSDDQDPELEQIVAAVKRRIGEVWHVQATVGLVPSRSLKKTTSGKIQRQACRTSWMDGHFNLLHMHAPDVKDSHLKLDSVSLKSSLQDMPVDDRVDWLLELLRQLAQTKMGADVSAIGADDFLPDAGLDSLAASELLMLLEEKLQHSFPNTLFIEHPTLRSAAMRILQEMDVEFLGEPEKAEVEVALPFRPPHRFMPPASTRIGIVGGGVGGLITALELARTGYRHIVLYEADAECGGKVHTRAVGPDLAELGQNFFGDSFRTVLDLSREMGCELRLLEEFYQLWSEEYGYEEPPVRRAAKTWYHALTKAANCEMNPALPFPSLFPELDMPLAEFVKRHRLRNPHPVYLFDWNAMGYGMDHEISAAYVVPYLSVVGALGNSAYIAQGNQELWRRLASHLQTEWGVEICYNQRVTHLQTNDAGVQLQIQDGVGVREEQFDEVVSALPPDQLQRILVQDDPLQAYLQKFEYYGYAMHSFRAEGLFQSGAIFLPQYAATVGRTMLLQACHGHTGWYIAAQFSADHAKQPETVPTSELRQEMQEFVAKLGGSILEFGPEKDWQRYFPHLRESPVQNLRAIEGMQGQRHLWMVGSWLSFETTEHVARHARHLVRTCFDPAFAENAAEQMAMNADPEADA